MDINNIIGREYELDVMKHLYEKDDAVLMAIYGRRRWKDIFGEMFPE